MKASVFSNRNGDRSARSYGENGLEARWLIEPLERRTFMDAAAASLQLDAAFGQAGYASPMPEGHAPSTAAYDHLTPAADGKFYAIGYGQYAIFPAGFESFELLRVNGDGSPDTGFGVGGAVHVRYGEVVDFDVPWMSYHVHFDGNSLNVGSILIQPDGKVLLTVQASPQFLPDPWLVMRFNTDGSPDSTFGDGGMEVLPFRGLPVAWLQPNGKIDLVEGGGYGSGATGLTLEQLNPDGTRDTSFGINGESDTTLPLAAPADLGASEMSEQYSSDVLGATGLSDGGAVIYMADHTYTNWSTQQSNVYQVRVDAAGNVTSTTTLVRGGLLPYNGSYPISFAVQGDGKGLLLDSTTGTLTRFGLDGRPDATFGAAGVVVAFPTGFIGDPGAISIGQNGAILVTLSLKGGAASGLERLNADGSVDTAFAGGQPVFGFGDHQIIAEAAQLPDGSILTSLDDRTPLTYDQWEAGVTNLPSRLAKLIPTGGGANTFDLQSLEDAVITDDGSTVNVSDGGDSSGGDDSTTADGTGDDSTSGDSGSDTDFTGDNFYFDPTTDSYLTSDTQGLFDQNSGSDVFNPDGDQAIYD